MGLVDIFQLCCPHLPLQDVVSLCQSSKQVKSACLDQPDQQLQQWLQNAIKSHPGRLSLPDQQHRGLPTGGQIQLNLLRPRCATTHSICWLIRQCCRSWGLLPLASRLQLQKALLAAQDDPVLSALLISAGARVTEPLLISAAWEGNPGPLVWVRLQQFLGVWSGLPELISDFCPEKKKQPYMGKGILLLSAGYLLDLAAVMWSKPALSRADILSFVRDCCGRWLPQQHKKLLHLMISSIERGGLAYLHRSLSEPFWVQGLIQLPVADCIDLLEAAAARSCVFNTLWLLWGSSITSQQAAQLCCGVLRSQAPDRIAAVLDALPPSDQLTDADTVQQLLQLAVEEGSWELLAKLVQAPAAEQLTPAAAEELLTKAADSASIRCWCLLHQSCCAGVKVPVQSILDLIVTWCNTQYAGCDAGRACWSYEGYVKCAYCRLLSMVSYHATLGDFKLGVVLKMLTSTTPEGLMAAQAIVTSMSRICAAIREMVSSTEEVEQVVDFVMNLSPRQQQWFMKLLGGVLGSAAGQQLGAEALENWLKRVIAEDKGEVVGVLLSSLPAAAAEVVQVEELVKFCIDHGQAEGLKAIVEYLPGIKGLGVEVVCKLLLRAEDGDQKCVCVLEKLLGKMWGQV